MRQSMIDPIAKTTQSVEAVLDKSFAASGKTLEQKLSNTKKKLPRKLRKLAKTTAEIEKRARYQPYLLDGQAKTLEKARKTAAQYVDIESKAANKIAARKQWLSGLILTYTTFLVLLFGFWYISTQM